MPARHTTPSANWRDWYSYELHRKRARFQLANQPWCEFCLKKEIVRAARIADHVIPVQGSWHRFRTGRLQSLCQECHSRDKRLLERYGCDPTIDISGFPRDPEHPVNANTRATTPAPDPKPTLDIADLIG
jgi:hypothetical protein